MNTKEFNRWLQWIRNGDKRGMEAFYKNYYEKIKVSAVADGICSENAHDVASKALLDIFSHADSYGYVENPNAWMYRVVTNAIINYKKQNAKYIYTDLIDDVYSTKDAKLDFKIDFQCFLQKLPPRQREIVILHYIYGFKIKDAAKQLEISVSTANRDIFSLKGELKKFL